MQTWFKMPKKYRYYICDVFTDQRFGGNPLAVLPDAAGLSTHLMQSIAREFNFSETTFVLPAEKCHTHHVRIFTPTQEVPFAGHPNIGTAFVLAEIGEITTGTTVTFEEGAGPVPIAIRRDVNHASVSCELKAPQDIAIGSAVSPATVAAVLSIDVDEVETATHPPQVASVGLPFLIVELRDRAALSRARINIEKLEALKASGVVSDIHAYTASKGEFDLHSRMYAPLDNIPEDPATGSANCALVGMLTCLDSTADGNHSWSISQGTEMGRPSSLFARTLKENGTVSGVWIAGNCVMVSEGWIYVA